MTVAERGKAPLVGALGGVIGDIAAQMQLDAGVDLRTGVAVEGLDGDAAGHVRAARLSDGTVLDVDVVVASLGSIRNVEWLEGAQLASGLWGVACDAGCRAFDINGVVTDNIFVAGDVGYVGDPAAATKAAGGTSPVPSRMKCSWPSSLPPRTMKTCMQA